ncbi:MAG: putative porin, partial [Bacteroidota bacterium]|nr:putative porin [Bacteroidota bacterium]
MRDYGSWTWRKDSLTLLHYQRFSDIAALHPYVRIADLGNFGQPHGILSASAIPHHATVSLNGIPADDFVTASPPTDMLPLEDAASITVYPQYQSFWYGAPGDVFAADVVQKEWDAPRPVTRLRHTEAANEYLFTDAMFTLNPSERGNLFLAGTRMTIGGAAGTNTARFENTLAESWNLRARYREHISSIFTTSIALRYNDELTHLNGGVSGTYDPLRLAYRYEEDGRGTFAASAFDPITAPLVNATMETHRQRYTATAELVAYWTADSSQTTRIRLQAISDVRRFRDDLSDVDELSDVDDVGLVIPRFNTTDHWTRYRAQLDHQTALPWAHLTLRGHVARFAASKGGGALDEDGLETGSRGRLDLLLGPVALSGFAALDYRYDQTAVSLGTGAELPLGALSLWGGVSFSPRIRSYLATAYTPALLVVSGDRTPDLDKVSIAEGGLRLHTEVLEADLRGFVRREDRYHVLQTTPYQGEIPGRYTLVATAIPGGGVQTVSGASLTAGLSFWRFRLDQQAIYQRTESSHALLSLPLAPERYYTAALYFRGNLIEGTLDLKAGGRFTYSSAYQPLTYHPQAGIFTLPAVV